MEGYSALILPPCHILQMLFGYRHPSVPAIQPSSAPVSFSFFFSFYFIYFFFLIPRLLTSVSIHSFCVSVCILLCHLTPCFFAGMYLCSPSLPHFLFSCHLYPTLYSQTQSYLCALDISSRCLRLT